MPLDFVHAPAILLERSHRPSRVARRLGPGTFASFIRLTYRLGPPSDGLFSASERPATPDFHVSEETLMQTPKAMICKSREDQNHWRARAEAARVHAQQMIEPVTKGMMVEVAEYYESLARRAGGKIVRN